jgi:hypothetical protein
MEGEKGLRGKKNMEQNGHAGYKRLWAQKQILLDHFTE